MVFVSRAIWVTRTGTLWSATNVRSWFTVCRVDGTVNCARGGNNTVTPIRSTRLRRARSKYICTTEIVTPPLLPNNITYSYFRTEQSYLFFFVFQIQRAIPFLGYYPFYNYTFFFNFVYKNVFELLLYVLLEMFINTNVYTKTLTLQCSFDRFYLWFSNCVFYIPKSFQNFNILIYIQLITVNKNEICNNE